MREDTSEECVPRFLIEEEVHEGRKKEREKERFERNPLAKGRGSFHPARSLSLFSRSAKLRSRVLADDDGSLEIGSCWCLGRKIPVQRMPGPPPRDPRIPRSTMRKTEGRLLPQLRQSVRLVEFNLDYISRGVRSLVGCTRARGSTLLRRMIETRIRKRGKERRESRCSLASRLRMDFERRVTRGTLEKRMRNSRPHSLSRRLSRLLKFNLADESST